MGISRDPLFRGDDIYESINAGPNSYAGIRFLSQAFQKIESGKKAGGFLFLSSQLSCDLKKGKIIQGNIGVNFRKSAQIPKLHTKTAHTLKNKLVF